MRCARGEIPPPRQRVKRDHAQAVADASEQRHFAVGGRVVDMGLRGVLGRRWMHDGASACAAGKHAVDRTHLDKVDRVAGQRHSIPHRQLCVGPQAVADEDLVPRIVVLGRKHAEPALAAVEEVMPAQLDAPEPGSSTGLERCTAPAEAGTVGGAPWWARDDSSCPPTE